MCQNDTDTRAGNRIGLPFKSRNWRRVKALRSNITAIFPPASSICGSLGQQSLLDTEPSVREIQHAPSLSKLHRACFHTFPITVKQKIEKIVSKTSKPPNLWSWTVVESGRQHWGVMVKHAAWSLHSPGTPKKHTKTPRGFGGIRKSLSFHSVLFFF